MITAAQTRKANRAATFEGNSDTPAIVVAGAAVHAYIEDGRLVVSVHLDTGDVLPELLNSDEGVPITINVGDTTVYTED